METGFTKKDIQNFEAELKNIHTIKELIKFCDDKIAFYTYNTVGDGFNCTKGIELEANLENGEEVTVYLYPNQAYLQNDLHQLIDLHINNINQIDLGIASNQLKIHIIK